MKLAVITDSSAVLAPAIRDRQDVTVLPITVSIDGVDYIEGETLTAEAFYGLMAQAKDLPKTSQPSLATLEETLAYYQAQGYTHVIGLFLSSGISGFWQNIQYLKDEFPRLEIAFPDSKITCVPLGVMVTSLVEWADEGMDFETIKANLQVQIEGTKAYILVDDLNHLVKGGRLSNGSALLGNLLNIKPILYFNDEGVIVVYEKIRTEKKAIKRLMKLMLDGIKGGHYKVFVIHANAQEKAKALKFSLEREGVSDVEVANFGSVIGTHLGEGAIALGYVPIIDTKG